MFWPANLKEMHETSTHKQGRKAMFEVGSITTGIFLTGSYLHVRSPQGQVVSEQLHDQRAVLVGFLSQSVKFSNSLIKSLCNKPIDSPGAL